MERPTDQLKEWEWIERYWAGKLSGEEKAFFERVMKEDERFAREAESLREGVRNLEKARMEQQIRQTLRHLRATDRRARLVRLRWIGVGSGLVAACLGFLLFLSIRPVRLPDYENDWEVIRDLQSQYQTDSTDQLSRQRKQAFDLFFEAQALFSEGQPGPAAQRFEQVLTFANLRPYFREAVQWHLVVCYLETDQPAKARELFNQLKQKKTYDIGLLSRWQIGWQIRLADWFGS